MKPYKILYPSESLWANKKLEVTLTEKKITKLPLKLLLNCSPMPKSSKTADKLRIINDE